MQLVYIFPSFLSSVHKNVNTKDKAMAWIIHYKSFGNFFELKHVTTNTEIGLRKAKAIKKRIKGENYHEEQRNKIPSTIDKSKRKLHMECYKKFTLINSNNKYNKVQTNEARETRRLSSR